ncbi:hypothetical protein B0H14DRAFT_3427495 [Mycena olivaceomarginata]|nr:hypothetical protein B0H14DRAFT_3427495 [Mycena olivaceomarginata]
MAHDSNTTTNAATSEQEMAALVAKVTTLSKLALDMTRLCIDVNDNLPALVQSQVAAAVAAVTSPGPKWYHSPAPSPDEMDAMFPPGYLDNVQWYVVCVGRRPRPLYQDADDQVRGVPNQLRKRKDSRQEALLYYRSPVPRRGGMSLPPPLPPPRGLLAGLHSFTLPALLAAVRSPSSYTHSHVEVEVSVKRGS